MELMELLDPQEIHLQVMLDLQQALQIYLQ
jgi:hypothetical protein